MLLQTLAPGDLVHAAAWLREAGGGSRGYRLVVRLDAVRVVDRELDVVGELRHHVDVSVDDADRVDAETD